MTQNQTAQELLAQDAVVESLADRLIAVMRQLHDPKCPKVNPTRTMVKDIYFLSIMLNRGVDKSLYQTSRDVRLTYVMELLDSLPVGRSLSRQPALAMRDIFPGEIRLPNFFWNAPISDKDLTKLADEIHHVRNITPSTTASYQIMCGRLQLLVIAYAVSLFLSTRSVFPGERYQVWEYYQKLRETYTW